VAVASDLGRMRRDEKIWSTGCDGVGDEDKGKAWLEEC
jgi:hypothetical protein